jgi:hypothetical protein
MYEPDSGSDRSVGAAGLTPSVSQRAAKRRARFENTEANIGLSHVDQQRSETIERTTRRDTILEPDEAAAARQRARDRAADDGAPHKSGAPKRGAHASS